MNQISLYIAGPMTGLPNYNYPAFNAAEKQLQDAGYATLNPTRSSDRVDAPRTTRPGSPWEDYMRNGINQLIRADGIVLLPNWGDSRGANIEVDLAGELGINGGPLEYWLDRAKEARRRALDSLVHIEPTA